LIWTLPWVKLLQRLTGRHLAARGRIVIGDVAFRTTAAREEARSRWEDLWDDEEHYWAADEAAAAFERAGFRLTYRQMSGCGGVLALDTVAAGADRPDL